MIILLYYIAFTPQSKIFFGHILPLLRIKFNERGGFSLNILFLAMFILSAVAVAVRSPDAFLPALLEGAGNAVTLSVALVSVYAVWLGFLKVCEHCGIFERLFQIGQARHVPIVPRER